ncbi:MAG: signal peptidase I [Candidatus Kapabacteria bacterium]|nr:signal peptidase I [Candidatus Kapabacteria bacterium]MCS7169596.1 signal peptidase I [Candidatus Kapabacteria bacterium]MDW7997461.1 signal peptidase I [Bacteroidota bacterium]MDW8225871.1 signal peptidase I [Bacteroidota bacterium]
MRFSINLRIAQRWWHSWQLSRSVVKPRRMVHHDFRSRGRLRGRDLFEAAALALLVGLLLKLLVVDFCRVPSGSMMPTLLPGDHVVVSRAAYAVGLPERLPFISVWLPVELRLWYRFPKRWDVIVIDFPGRPGQARPDTPQYYIKRVVGLPGDTLRFSGDTLIINRVAYWLPGLREPLRNLVVPYRGMTVPLSVASAAEWLPLVLRDGAQAEVRQDGVYINGQPAQSYVVRHDYVFVMGDNYRTSWDSRSWGVVPQGAIVGKAILVYYSRSEDGHTRWNRIGRFLY